MGHSLNISSVQTQEVFRKEMSLRMEKSLKAEMKVQGRFLTPKKMQTELGWSKCRECEWQIFEAVL